MAQKVSEYNKFAAFDLDNTLCKTDIVLREAVLGNFGFDIFPIQEYALEIPGLSQKEFKLFVRDTIKRTSPDILPYNETLEVLHSYHEKTNYPIVIITARHESLSFETHEWCRKWLDIPYSVYFLPSEEKRALMLWLGVKYYVDDRGECILDLQNRSSINSYLINRSYNRNVDVSKESRVNNLWEFHDKIF